MSALVISLDFELFWGVIDSKTVVNYGANIEGEWKAVPAMLALFKQYGVHVTWATVGMIMCKDFKQWSYFRPSVMPTYEQERYSTYSVAPLVLNFPKLFFARSLVDKILETDGQELASHTYSHFFCNETGTTIEQFAADLECAQAISKECGFKSTSLVFPRNQVKREYLRAASTAGFTAYRDNQDHWLYRDGHYVPYGVAGRFVRAADAYIALTGNHTARLQHNILTESLSSIPASMFLRPSSGSSIIDKFSLARVRKGMLEAAITDAVFHLWWHPHNFGQKMETNLKNLEEILKYYRLLNQKYGMQSLSMRELAR
jgi:peptidoglycan/xylan/chitin deacetylase (PgdA/CDA1 family)